MIHDVFRDHHRVIDEKTKIASARWQSQLAVVTSAEWCMRGTAIATSGMPIAIATPQAFNIHPFHVRRFVRNRVHIFFGFRLKPNLCNSSAAKAATKPSMHLGRLIRLLRNTRLCLLHFCGSAVAAAQPLLVLLESAMKWLHSPTLHLP